MNVLKLKTRNTEFAISFDNAEELIEFITKYTERADEPSFKSISGEENDN